ncbi:MAG: serine hydrolase [Bacteroidales bacterium]|nr:serine hydrolase [Bacteroidales bacterium]
MKKLFYSVILLLLSISLSAQVKKEKTDQRLAGIDAKLQVLLSDWNVPGLAVAVVEKKKVLYARGFGYRDYENKIPVTPNTLFAIGSCTKAFTSALLGQLRNESLVDFDKSPGTYLPDLRFYNQDLDNLVTIRDMMCHRTGLPRHDMSWYIFPTDSRDSLMKRIRYMEPSAAVRQKYQYNNFMFMLQGLVAEKITGTSWEKNIENRFFKPLGMANSVFTIDDLEKSNDAALGYTLLKDSVIEKTDYYRIRAMSPAGSINSSVNDMSRWLISWINNGKYEGKDVLPSSYISEAISSQMVASAGLPQKNFPDRFFDNYGYGWDLTSYKGHYLVQHGGNIDGFSALTCFFPTDSIGIVILVNQNGSGVPGIVRNIVADRMLKLKDFDWNKHYLSERDKARKSQKEAEVKSVSGRIKDTSPSHKIKEYEGKYSNPGYGTIRIRTRGDSMFALVPLKKFWLRHYHYDVFQPYEITKHGIDSTITGTLLFNFRTNNGGELESFSANLEGGIKPIEFKRVKDDIKIEKGVLEKYVGEYAIGEIVSRIYIKNDKTLFLFVPGQPEYELAPAGTDTFKLIIIEGFKIQFTKADNGVINGLLFIQPNGTFRATRKQE